jgi:hypothetical protein
MHKIEDKKHEIAFHNNHNVFILGAGFSADAGLPTMKNFIPAMRHAVSWAEQENLPDLGEDIIRSLAFRKLSASAAYRCKIDPNNIEDIFSLFDGCSTVSRNNYDRISMQKAIAATLESRMALYRQSKKSIKVVFQEYLKTSFSKNYIDSLQNSTDSSGQKIIPLYEACAALFANSFDMQSGSTKQPKNTVITFNYDTLLEESLEEISAPYNLGILDSDISVVRESQNLVYTQVSTGLSILKLHGSMNWAMSYQPHENHQNRSPSDKTYPCIQIYKTATDLFSHDAHLYDQLILEPPTWNKGKSASILQLLWDKSIEALSTATRIFIIGYSMPETDMHFKYLMASGLASNISLEEVTIVNPAFEDVQESEALRARVFKVFREEHESDRSIKLIPYTASNFILAPGGAKLSHANLLPFILFPTLSHSFFLQANS